MASNAVNVALDFRKIILDVEPQLTLQSIMR